MKTRKIISKASFKPGASKGNPAAMPAVLINKLPRIQAPTLVSFMGAFMLLWKSWKATPCPETSVADCYHLALYRQGLPTPRRASKEIPTILRPEAHGNAPASLSPPPWASQWALSSLSPSFYTHSNTHAQSDPFTPSLKLSLPTWHPMKSKISQRDKRLPSGCSPCLPSPTEKPSSVPSFPCIAVTIFYLHGYLHVCLPWDLQCRSSV